MAESVKVKHNDTITLIINSKRDVQGRSVYLWLSDVRRLNPHISNLDRIYPGEHILIPDRLNENVSFNQIWNNALSQIPKTLQQSQNHSHCIYFCGGIDRIDDIAKHMFSKGQYSKMPLSSKRAVLLFKNPHLINYLPNKPPSSETLLDITPVFTNYSDVRRWISVKPMIENGLSNMDFGLRNMVTNVGPEPSLTMAQIVESLKSAGSGVGVDDVIKGASYGIAGVSGHAAAGELSVSIINSLMRELYNEAIEKFGSKIVHSKKTSHLAKIQQFLQTSPKYNQLIGHLNNIPKHLLAKLNITPVNPNFNVARHFRKQVSMPLKKWSNPSKYLNSTAKQLNGRLSLLKGVSKTATWYVPAILGVASVATAPPELRVKRTFEEGFGILGGAIGTKAGYLAGLGIVAVLGLGPFGMFVAIFVCATAVGIAGMELGNRAGGEIYGNVIAPQNKIFNSLDEYLVETLQ